MNGILNIEQLLYLGEEFVWSRYVDDIYQICLPIKNLPVICTEQ